MRNHSAASRPQRRGRGLRLPRRPLHRFLAVGLAALLIAGVIQTRRSSPADADTPASGLSKTPSQAFTLQWANAYLAANVADISYRDDRAERSRLLARFGLEETGFVSKNQSQVLFAATRDRAFTFIGVRGTQEFRDILADANVGQIIPDWDRNVTVHAGFNKSADLIWNAVETIARRAEATGSTVFLTGHSLGGATAHILAYRLALTNVAFHSVYTFGAPKSGTSTWANAYNKRLASRTHDFVNKKDPMQCLPSNPVKDWTSLLGRHYHLDNNRVSLEGDVASCAPVGVSSSGVNKAIQVVQQVCNVITPKRIRKFLRKFYPGYCQPNGVVGSAVGLVAGVWQLANGRIGADHPIKEYIKNLGAAMPAPVKASTIVTRPVQVRALNVDGSLGTVTSDHTDDMGWTSVTSWTRDGHIFQAKVNDNFGRFKVEEITTAGVVSRRVNDGTVPEGMNVIGTYGTDARAPTHMVFFGAGHLQVRAIAANGALGAETSRLGLLDDVAIDDTSFGPTQAALYDIDGSGGELPKVMVYDEETGQYRVRDLAAGGRIGAELGRDTMTAGYTSIATVPGLSGGASLLFVNADTGAMAVRQIAGKIPGLLIQAVNQGQSVGGYLAEPGWTSVTVTGGEYGRMALFHNERTGATARYKLFFNGTFDFLIDRPSWAPGWTAITPVPVPNCCTLLSAVKE